MVSSRESSTSVEVSIQPSIFDMKMMFLDTLNTLMQEKAKNSVILSRDKYYTLIEDVKKAKAKPKKESIDYRRLRKYDVIEVDGKEKLIVPLTAASNCVLYYVHAEELFDLLHDTHLKIGHGGRTRMEKELQTKYKNVTKENITSYLRLCKPCQIKLSNLKKEIRGHTNFTITSTKRGKPMITHFGYDLILHNIDKKRPTRHWRCSRCWMGCKVRAKLLGYHLVYLPGAEHNHPPNLFIPCIDI